MDRMYTQARPRQERLFCPLVVVVDGFHISLARRQEQGQDHADEAYDNKDTMRTTTRRLVLSYSIVRRYECLLDARHVYYYCTLGRIQSHYSIAGFLFIYYKRRSWIFAPCAAPKCAFWGDCCNFVPGEILILFTTRTKRAAQIYRLTCLTAPIVVRFLHAVVKAL